MKLNNVIINCEVCLQIISRVANFAMHITISWTIIFYHIQRDRLLKKQYKRQARGRSKAGWDLIGGKYSRNFDEKSSDGNTNNYMDSFGRIFSRSIDDYRPKSIEIGG